MDPVAGIRLYTHVVEIGSFSRASLGLDITQAVATKHVAALEKRLGARLLHRSTRDATPTKVGAAYCDKCKAIAQQLQEANNLALLAQARLGGTLCIDVSVSFGRRVLTLRVLEFMHQLAALQVELNSEDRHASRVQQGRDVAVRMGCLADSQLGARTLGTNPWPLWPCCRFMGCTHRCNRARCCRCWKVGNCRRRKYTRCSLRRRCCHPKCAACATFLRRVLRLTGGPGSSTAAKWHAHTAVSWWPAFNLR